jgi:hypothetical protein
MYSEAQANPNRAEKVYGVLERMDGTNGSLQDMRDQTTLLREHDRKLWLGENRPYFLDNILVRYDEELARWEAEVSHVNRLPDVLRHPCRLPPLIEL